MLDAMNLAAGAGVCTPVAVALIKPYREVLDLGVAPDILRAAFNAVHRANRHSHSEDYAAITLPSASNDRGIHGLGDTIAIFGSEEILEAVLQDSDMRKMKRRNMFAARIREAHLDHGDMGTYLARDRRHDKVSTGAAARQARRDARRAEHIAATRGQADGSRPDRVRPDGVIGRGFITLKADRKIDFVAGKAVWTGLPVTVSTYGLSSPGSIAVLPGAPHERA